MSKIENEDLIELGAASAETKGAQTSYPADEINQHRLVPGLAND